MKKDIEQILNTMGTYAQNVKLSRADKTRLRSDIFEKTAGISSPLQPEKSPYLIVSEWTKHISKKTFVFVPVSLAFVLLIGGGVVGAAENALPGDVLYPIKTAVNERAIGLFSNTPEEIAKYQTDLASRRLDEVTKLALAGRLTAESRVELEEEVSNHLAQVDEQVSALKAGNNINGALAVSSQVESSLRANAKVLEEVSQNVDGETSAAVVAVKARADHATLVRIQLEDEIIATAEHTATLTLAEEKRVQAEESISDAEKLLAEVKLLEGTDLEEIEGAEERLVIARELLVEGDAVISSDSKEAYVAYQKSARLAVEVSLVLETQQEIGAVPQAETTEEEVDANLPVDAPLE